MSVRSAATATSLIIAALILLAVGAGLVAIWRIDPWGATSTPMPQQVIDPKLIQYEQTAVVVVPMEEPRAVAMGLGNRIYVAGDKAVQVFDSAGQKRREIPLEDAPKCLSIGDMEHVFPGRLYIGMAEHVVTVDADGKHVADWPSLGQQAQLLSIAVAEHEVFVADAGNKIIWHYDPAGKLKGRIGDPDPARKIRGFTIPSRYFDAAVGHDGLLYVVNPGARHVEAYTFQGDLEFHWGKGSSEIDGFFGCCNPVHLATFPDGRFVTAEKGFPRVKVYSARGQFECVVAGPEQCSATAADLAVDSQGRVLVLDPTARRVRIFTRKQNAAGETR